jgi:hypothetical protein
MMVAEERMNRAGEEVREMKDWRRLRRGDLAEGVTWRRTSMARMRAKMVRSRVLPANGAAAEAWIGCCSIPKGRGGIDAGIFLLLLADGIVDAS